MTFTVKNDDDSMMTVSVADELEQIKKALHEQREFNQKLLQEFAKQYENTNKLVEVVTQDRELFNQSKELLDSIINDSRKAAIEVAAAEQEVKKQGFFARLFGK